MGNLRGVVGPCGSGQSIRGEDQVSGQNTDMWGDGTTESYCRSMYIGVRGGTGRELMGFETVQQDCGKVCYIM